MKASLVFAWVSIALLWVVHSIDVWRMAELRGRVMKLEDRVNVAYWLGPRTLITNSPTFHTWTSSPVEIQVDK